MAQGDGHRIVRNAPFRWTFGMEDASGNLVAGQTVTVQNSLDGSSFSTVTGTVVEIGAAGLYYIDITAAELTGDEIIFKATSSGATDTWHLVQPEPAMDSGVAQAGAAGSITIRSAVADSGADAAFVGGVIEIVRGTGRGQCRQCDNYTTSTKIASVDRNWATNPDSTSVYVIHPVNASSLLSGGLANVSVSKIDGSGVAATNMAALYKGAMIHTSVNDSSATTTVWIGTSGDLTGTNDFYNNAMCVFTSGNLIGLSRKILDYTGGTFSFQMSSAFPEAPGNGDTFMIISRIE